MAGLGGKALVYGKELKRDAIYLLHIIHVILLWSTKNKQQTRKENDMNKESGSRSPSSSSSGTGTTQS